MSPASPPPPPAFDPTFPAGGGPARTSAAAIASVILGALSLFCFCLTGLPGLICGFVGLSNIDKSGGKLKGKGLAITGIILSVLLPMACVAISYVQFGATWKSNPALREIFSAGKHTFQATTQGTDVAAALRKYADAHSGVLPQDVAELSAEGLIDESKLTSPVDGAAGFWKMLEGGRTLSELPATTVIATGGPITVQNEELKIVIRANGQVEPTSVKDGGRRAP